MTMMRMLVLMLVVLVVLCCLLLPSSIGTYAHAMPTAMTEHDYRDEFVRFLQRFDKQYTIDEVFDRYATFKRNLDVIHAHNADPVRSRMSKQGVHYYSDWTKAEIKAKLVTRRPAPLSSTATTTTLLRDLPTSVNWVKQGAVTPVSNEGQCGASWAYSAAGAVESLHFLQTANLVPLSVQQLIDCAGGGTGCTGGGSMTQAFAYVVQNGGLCSAASYPYSGGSGVCQPCMPVAPIASYSIIIMGNETDLQVHVAAQPVSVTVEADSEVFLNYVSGVIDSPACGTNVDHGVLVVGYGTDTTTGVPYWLVKNSWGASWGEQGYVRIARGQGVCGIALAASYPVGK